MIYNKKVMLLFSEIITVVDLYCFKCGEKIKYTGEGVYVCAKCGYEKYIRENNEQTLDLHSKAEFYQKDSQYFNALKMYEILIKNDPSDYTAFYGAILAEYGARFEDNHDSTFSFSCERTQEISVYDGEHYSQLSKTAPEHVMKLYAPVISDIFEEQKKNNEKYLESAPVDEHKDYREEARRTDERLADDYLQARERYLEAERQEQEEAQLRRLEAKERAEAAQKARENRAALEAKRERTKKLIIKLSCAFLAVVILTIASFAYIIPQIRYNLAVGELDAGNYDSAAKTFRDLGGFGNSSEMASKYRLFGLDVGDVVVFGSYEQNNSASDGGEDIEWIVLAVDADTVTLMSKYVLDCVQYHENKSAPSYWESASLRAWLNGEFYGTAFSEADRALIKEKQNENPDNEECKTVGGADTSDFVYCLDLNEAGKYLSEGFILGVPTEYAKEKGTYQKDGFDGTYYWLRSPGSTQNSAAFVSYEGKITPRGASVDYKSYGVRPCITVKKSVIE